MMEKVPNGLDILQIFGDPLTIARFGTVLLSNISSFLHRKEHLQYTFLDWKCLQYVLQRSGGVRLTTLLVLSLPEIGWIPAGTLVRNPPYHRTGLASIPWDFPAHLARWTLDSGQPFHSRGFSSHLNQGLASPPLFAWHQPGFHVFPKM